MKRKVRNMKKKLLAGVLSVLMSVTMYTPVRAEEMPEQAGSEPEFTEVQQPEEQAAEQAEWPEPMSDIEEPAETEYVDAGEQDTYVVPAEAPEEIPVIAEEPEVSEEEPVTEEETAAEVEETEAPASEENIPVLEEDPEDMPEEAAEEADDEDGEEKPAEEEPAVTEEPEEVTLITPEPVTFNGVTVTVSYYSDVFDTDVTLAVSEAGEAETAALNALGKDYRAVDIKFVDTEGNPAQPAEGKTVSVSLKAPGMEAAENYTAVYVGADGTINPLDAQTSADNEVSEQVKTGETTRTVYMPAETETATVQDYREETYTDYETRETVVEVPAEIGYRDVLKTREVERTVTIRAFLKSLLFGSRKNEPQTITTTEYYYEKEPYVVREAYTKTVTETVPVEKTRTVLSGTHEETRVIREAYSYEETDDIYETVTRKDVEAAFDASHFSVYAVIEGESSPEARARVEFYGINTGSPVVTYYVKNSDQMPPVNEADRQPGVQYIDDIVTDPGIGGALPANQIFVGWYIGNSDDYTTATAPKTIQDVRQYLADQTFTEGETVIKVYAMIFKIFTVTYLDEQNISMGSDEVKVRTSESSGAYTVSKTYVPVDPTKNFEGWQTENDSSISDAQYGGEAAAEPYKMGTTMTISGDITFTVSAPKGRWLVFDENGRGATYIAPQFVRDGEVAQEPTLDMTRLGFTFDGWYTVKYDDDATPDEANRFEFGQELEQPSTTIYAKWTPVETAHYTVIYWKQKVDGSDYDFDHSQTITGNVGTTINVTATGTTVAVTGADTYNIEKGFSFKEADEGKTISATGNTVVNVYIQRNQYTLTFTAPGYTYTPTTSNFGTQYGLVNGAYVELNWHLGWTGVYWTYGDTWGSEGPVYNGTRYTRSQGQVTVKEITAYYEQNISDYFPIEGDNGTTYNNGERWKPGTNGLGWTEVMVFIDTMPNENVTFTLDEATRPLKTMYYYVEALDTDTATITHKGTKYVLYNTISARYNGVTAEDFIDLDGFAKVEATATIGGAALTPHTVSGLSGLYYIASQTQDQSIYFFYTRLKYSINFMDGGYFDGEGNPLNDDYSPVGQWKAVDNIVYGSNIASYNKGGSDYYEPAAAYPGFIFEGWYIDDRCTTPYTFTTMPKGGLTLYAKWRQIQYRVFMHPNAKLPDGTNDNTLDWGSAAQDLNFRVSYMGQVSMPTGLRDEYEFIGWFLDEATTIPFNEDTKLTEDIVTTDYDKTDPANYTDPMNKFGEIEGQGSNSDLTGNNGSERFWITKKLDLYGKWSAILTGAQGIGVIYDANGGSNAPDDTRKYKDNVQAVAQAASTPPAKQRFLYWVVQKWDGTEYVDVTDSSGKLLTVYPGDGFTVLKDYAKVTDLTPGDEGYSEEDEIYKAYTMQLRAEYGPEEANKDTYMNWYRNDQDPSELLHEDTDLLINQGVDIYTLTAGIPVRTGYRFLGWAREAEYTLSEDNKPIGDAITYYDVDEDDLYLKWVKDTSTAGGHYEAQNSSGTWVTVTQVAADEKMPYQAWYAVWEPDYIFIFHSATGDLEAVQYTDSIDLTGKVTEGYLYGGYYSAYSAYEVTDTDKENAEKSATLRVHVTDNIYDPATAADHIGRWTSADAYTDNGSALAPEAQTVYYLKEVPVSYLRNYHQITYVKSTGALTGLYLLSAVDDTTYSGAGFILQTNDGKPATIVQSLAITNSGTGKSVTLKANTAFRSAGIASTGGGYLGYWNATGSDYYAPGTFTVLPYWDTPDGVRVTGISTRTVTISSMTKSGISKSDE